MAMESRAAALRSDTSSPLQSDSAFSLAAVDADRTPMPTAAIDANREIMNQAGAMTSQAMRASQVGLGNVVGGNNPVMSPPARQASGLNAALLAGGVLGGLAIGGAFSKDAPRKAGVKKADLKAIPDKNAKPTQPSDSKTPEAATSGSPQKVKAEGETAATQTAGAAPASQGESKSIYSILPNDVCGLILSSPTPAKA